MALEFQTVKVNTLPSNNQSVKFTNTVNAANATVQAFNLTFGPDTDQFIDTVFVEVTGIQVSGNTVTFNVDANMESANETTTIQTGKGSGSVTVLVMADVKSAG